MPARDIYHNAVRFALVKDGWEILVVYRDILIETKLDFQLYLAITKGTYKSYFQRKLAQMIINRNQVNLLIVDSESEVIEQWID